jgi:hypothetical protein
MLLRQYHHDSTTESAPDVAWLHKLPNYCMVQEIYGGLEEPDGLEGLVQLRAGGPCPADTRLAAEKVGAWSEALSLHEQVTYKTRVRMSHTASLLELSSCPSEATSHPLPSLPSCKLSLTHPGIPKYSM